MSFIVSSAQSSETKNVSAKMAKLLRKGPTIAMVINAWSDFKAELNLASLHSSQVQVQTEQEASLFAGQPACLLGSRLVTLV